LKYFKADQISHFYSADEINKVPRYSVTVADHWSQDVLNLRTAGVFIIPLGAERHMQLDQEEKRKSLMEQANFSRLIIVQLGVGHKYEDIKQI
jgi:hypothetical protein